MFESEIWSQKNEASINVAGVRQIIPLRYKTVELAINDLKAELSIAVLRTTTNQAQAVVIPHVGQGRFNNRTIVHSRNPNWRCVPNPAGSGRRHRAVTKSPARDKLIANRPNLQRPGIFDTGGTTTVSELAD